MAIPEKHLEAATRALRVFAERVPPEIRPKLSYHWKVRGNQITLIEQRPHFFEPGRMTNIGFARLQFNLQCSAPDSLDS